MLVVARSASQKSIVNDPRLSTEVHNKEATNSKDKRKKVSKYQWEKERNIVVEITEKIFKLLLEKLECS